jgi:hypothetical protein
LKSIIHLFFTRVYMFIGMFVDLKVHHDGIMHHAPFSYVDGDVHDVPGYDVDVFNMRELKELVWDFRYVNEFKCWYNVLRFSLICS